MPGVTEALGVDIAPTAISMAQARWQSMGNARFLLADYLKPPPDWRGAFDAVVEHTCYCAIPRLRRDDYARATGVVLKPGGLFLAMFYLTPRDNPDPDLGPPFNATQEEVIARFGTVFELVTAHVPEVAYPGREGREWLCLFRRRE
jgi:SAM-dependent methyltransferase